MEYTVGIFNKRTGEIKSINYDPNTEKLIKKVKRIFSRWIKEEDEKKEDFSFELSYIKDEEIHNETFPNIFALIHRIKIF